MNPQRDSKGLEKTRKGSVKGHEVTPRAQNCRSILVPHVVEGGSSVFVSIRVHSWFVFNNDRPFFLE